MNNRPQVPDIWSRRSASLNPTPIQSDTYVRPARAPIDRSREQLASALGAFSGNIQGLNQALLGDNKKKADEASKEAQWAAEKRIGGMTREEVRKEVQSGSRPNYSDPFAQRAHNAASGFKYGADRAEQLKGALLQDFDWDNNDPEQFIQAAINEDLEKYGSDKNFGKNYLRQMQSLQNWAIGFGEKRKQQGFVEDQHRAAFDVIDTIVTKSVAAGADPAKIAQTVFNEYSNLSKKGTLGVDAKQLDQEVLNKARRIAATNPEVAIALISHEYKGSDGKMRSLTGNPQMRDTILNIQAQATKAISGRQEADFLAGVHARDADLIAQGRGNEIGDQDYKTLDGKSKTLDGKKRRAAAVEAFLENSKRMAEEGREPEPVRLARELRSLRLSGEKHPGIESAVSGISEMASIDMAQDPEARNKLLGKLEAYKWLQSESTNSTLAYTKKADRDFAETYLMAQRYLNQDQETALTTAIRSTKLTGAGASKLSKLEFLEMERKVKSIASKPGILWGTNDTIPQNYSVVEQNVNRLATTFISLGLSPDKAVDAAAEAVKKNVVTHNGVVIDAQGYDLPDNFTGVLDETLTAFSKANAGTMERNDLEVSDLSIVPAQGGSVHGGRFLVVDKDTMLPINDNAGNTVFLTLSGLRKEARKIEERVSEKAAKAAAFNSSILSNNLSLERSLTGEDVWINKKTREEFKHVYEKGSLTPKWTKTGHRLGTNLVYSGSKKKKKFRNGSFN